ncbi:acyl carrier protein [Rhodococcus sp. 14-2470-1a]|uniref:acyl carrier protein n=1 Tax=Rhodococcus sp. 14-2470-1a TaxID=2023150 RepID=UPI001C529943|nr:MULTISPECIES: acyl carrier protein [unclassified Rhodococcus (in: high G+C Gram-positive bacteria)]
MFEGILRPYLPFLSPEEQLTEDLQLRDVGLDSLGTVELLGQLEAGYDVRFDVDALTMETFETPAVLWKTISSLTSDLAR